MDFPALFFRWIMAVKVRKISNLREMNMVEIKRYACWEKTVQTEGNIRGVFRNQDSVICVEGFEKARGVQALRFMPEREGVWEYRIETPEKNWRERLSAKRKKIAAMVRSGLRDAGLFTRTGRIICPLSGPTPALT